MKITKIDDYQSWARLIESAKAAIIIDPWLDKVMNLNQISLLIVQEKKMLLSLMR